MTKDKQATKSGSKNATASSGTEPVERPSAEEIRNGSAEQRAKWREPIGTPVRINARRTADSISLLRRAHQAHKEGKQKAATDSLDGFHPPSVNLLDADS